MVYSIIIVTNFIKIRIHTLIMLITCGEKSRALMLTAYENTFYFALLIAFNNFFSDGHRFTRSTCTENMCNNSSISGYHFST